MKKRGLLFIVTGPSGVGKKTILDKIINNKDLNLRYSVSLTTRKPRIGEVDGVDYYFVSNEEFLERVKNNDFIEWAEFASNKYGTLKSEVEKYLQNGINVVLEIEVQGGQEIISKIKKDEYRSFFIMPPSIEELKNRLINRGTESIEKINLRIEKASNELNYKDLYDYIVLNDNLEKARSKIEKIIMDCINEN